ncbi:MAG: hypothetical protein NDI69_16740 [Bacteriovoracaceae bacterium]|nr:hypothetical protein [Bacteriovoracaceae bacterium]
MIRFLLLTLISIQVYAAPKELEVWFLSNAKVTQLHHLLNRPQYVYRAPVAKLECQEMGDYCFDPQYGLYKKDDAGVEVDAGKISEDKGPSIPSGQSLDRELINCDKANFFDVFCGKAKAQVKSETKLDLWVDTSSSMKEFDYSDKEGGCYRKSLVTRLDETCGFNQKVNVMMFDTSIKQAGSIDQMCSNQGLNDYKRLMDWIERSDAKKLVVITDIYEFHKEFSDFVESKNGKLRGDKDAMTAKQMLDLVDDLAKSCK